MESVQVFVRAAVARSANSLLAPPISMARSKILQPTLPDLLGKVPPRKGAAKNAWVTWNTPLL